MPLYEYQCRHCGIKVEKLEPTTASKEKDCEACRSKMGLQRLTSLTSFTLSGTSWYASGYSREEKNKAPANNDGVTTPSPSTTNENKVTQSPVLPTEASTNKES